MPLAPPDTKVLAATASVPEHRAGGGKMSKQFHPAAECRQGRIWEFAE